MQIGRDSIAWIIAGTVAGVAGWLLFMAMHAFLIVPIWNRGFGGIPFAVIAGATLAWTMREFDVATTSRAAGFAFLVWVLLMPATAVAGWLRVTGLRPRMGNWDTVCDLAIAAITACLAAIIHGCSRRQTIVLAICMAVLVTAMAGPIPVTNSARATMLFVAFLPMYVVAAVVIVSVRRVAIGTS